MLERFLLLDQNAGALFPLVTDSLSAGLVYRLASGFQRDGCAMGEESVGLLAAASLVGGSRCFPYCHDLPH